MPQSEALRYVVGVAAVVYAMAPWSSQDQSPLRHAEAAIQGGGGDPGDQDRDELNRGGQSRRDANHGGTRLQANYFVGDDGSRQFAYFTDRALGSVRCEWKTAADGRLRCLPATGATANGLYSDSTCAFPLALSDSASCPVPAYAVRIVSGSCQPPRLRIYSVVGPYTGPAFGQMASATGGTTCTAVPTPYVPDIYTASSSGLLNLLELGEELSPELFQLATTVAE